MNHYSLEHLANQDLLRNLVALVEHDRSATAEIVAHVAEVDARKLYLPAAYSSMFSYCVGELHMSEDMAFKRIRAARVARSYPGIFEAIANGRLSLTSVVVLSPLLISRRCPKEAGEDLLREAEGKTRREVERILAIRFPQPDVPATIRGIPSRRPAMGVESSRSVAADPTRVPVLELAPEPVTPQPPASGVPAAPLSLLAPPVLQEIAPASRRSAEISALSSRAYSVRFTMSDEMHDKFRHIQALLRHQIPSGDMAEILERGLDLLIEQTERRKFGAGFVQAKLDSARR